MPNNSELIQQADRLFQYVMMCSNLPMTAPACRPLWMIVVYVCAAAGTLLLLWAIWQIISYRLKYAAALRAQAAREAIAAPEVMASARFTEAGDVADDITDPHLAEKIRQELDRQRLAKLTGRPATPLPK